LPKEAKVLAIMKGEKGFAVLETILQENNYNILIMNLLGPNLEKLYKYCGGNFYSHQTHNRQVYHEDHYNACN
jgi:hypothetical protein